MAAFACAVAAGALATTMPPPAAAVTMENQIRRRPTAKRFLRAVRPRMETYTWNRYHLLYKRHGKDGYGTCIT